MAMGGGSAVASLYEAGMRMVKVEPSPGVLSTETSPPIIWQIFRVIARPRPGAAVLARGRGVGLREGLEQPADLLGRHADAGVAHAEDDPVAVRPAPRGRRPARMVPVPVNLQALPAG